jgi:hypothetical protein
MIPAPARTVKALGDRRQSRAPQGCRHQCPPAHVLEADAKAEPKPSLPDVTASSSEQGGGWGQLRERKHEPPKAHEPSPLVVPIQHRNRVSRVGGFNQHGSPRRKGSRRLGVSHQRMRQIHARLWRHWDRHAPPDGVGSSRNGRSGSDDARGPSSFKRRSMVAWRTALSSSSVTHAKVCGHSLSGRFW